MNEVDEKVERVARYARANGLGAMLLTRQHNFSWLSGGQTNRIDGSVDVGEGSLLVTASAKRYVVANAIEMPRLRDEALQGLGFEPVEYEWADDHQHSSAALKTAARVINAPIGSDVPAEGARDVNAAVRALQTPLTDPEVARYRALGGDVANAVERLCRSLQPGGSECSIAGMVNSAVATIGARAVVTLVAADERIARFRHPVPTSREWRHAFLIGLCAERQGLVVALSRVVSCGESPALRDLTSKAASVFARLVTATRPGVSGSELFQAATDAYRDAGYDGQEQLHHQGGAIGYQSRDWIAHRMSREIVHDRQAFAWNPSITGSKVEDTVLLLDGSAEPMTSTGEWPSIEISDRGGRVLAPGILEI
jgi:Xaa-Pro dipeptidase